MSFTVFLGNLPLWVTADDIKSWLAAENLVADNVKVIRNPETQESKGFAFIEAPNQEEMNSIIRRFDRAPLEDRLLRANPAQPPKGKGETKPGAGPMRSGSGFGDRRPAAGGPRSGAPASGGTTSATGASAATGTTAAAAGGANAGAAGAASRDKRRRPSGPPSAFAEELAKAL
jgi:RNA recognition motif-containing protein